VQTEYVADEETIAVQRLRDEASAWVADDPDPATRAELQSLIDGLPGSASELRDRFAGSLTFGSGLVIVPFLQQGLVEQYGWLDERQFLIAVAVGIVAYLALAFAFHPVVIGVPVFGV